MVQQENRGESAYVLLGTVVRPHGVKGELKVRPVTERPDHFARYRRLLLAVDAQAQKTECINEQTRVSGALVILRLRECTTREQAEALVGQQIWLPTDALPPPAEGEFYLYTLLGKAVQTTDGRILGQAERLLTGTGQDILVVRDEQQEYLIPIVRAFIRSIDAITVTLDLPDGLLDINS